MLCDEGLLSLLRKKPEKALDLMINKYVGLVYSIVSKKLSITCSNEDIEECVSDIFYEVYNKRESIDLKKASLKTFIAVVAKRKAIDFYRNLKNANSMSVSLEAQSYACRVESNSNVEKLVVTKEEQNAVIKGIKALGEPDSEIFIRKYYFGQSSRIIAKALGMKENTIDKKVSRGRMKLKEILGGVL